MHRCGVKGLTAEVAVVPRSASSLLGVCNKHLLKASNVPDPSNGIERQIGWSGGTTLKRPTLDMTACSNYSTVRPLQVVSTSLNGEVCEADIEGVARSNRWRAWIWSVCELLNTGKVRWADLP